MTATAPTTKPTPQASALARELAAPLRLFTVPCFKCVAGDRCRCSEGFGPLAGDDYRPECRCILPNSRPCERCGVLLADDVPGCHEERAADTFSVKALVQEDYWIERIFHVCRSCASDLDWARERARARLDDRAGKLMTWAIVSGKRKVKAREVTTA